MTAKQTLVGHMRERHPRVAAKAAPGWTFAAWQKVHALQHHRYYVDHYHAGTNTGSDNRPEGWYTGKDAVERT
jgi:hypothetical protein